MIAYVLLSAIVVGFWGMRAIRFQQFEIAGGNLQPTLCRWLEDSGLRTKIVFDPAWDFGLLATMSDGEPVYIVQLKEHRRFVTFQASLAIPAEQQAILKAMPGAYFEKLEEEVPSRFFWPRWCWLFAPGSARSRSFPSSRSPTLRKARFSSTWTIWITQSCWRAA
jgi:hypothetical protein